MYDENDGTAQDLNYSMIAKQAASLTRLKPVEQLKQQRDGMQAEIERLNTAINFAEANPELMDQLQTLRRYI